jgi:hypothetical protein
MAPYQSTPQSPSRKGWIMVSPIARVFMSGRVLLLCLASVALVADDPPAPSSTMALARLAVHAGSSERVDTPVSTSVAGLPIHRAGEAVALFEVVDGQRVPVASQVDDSGEEPDLCWILSGTTAPGQTRVFELVQTPQAPSEAGQSVPAVSLDDSGGALTVSVHGRPALRYQHEPIPPLPGTSPLYERGGFIHPLWSPKGEVLTRIQPPDHLHHFGIWNPWTHTQFEGRQIDFWNIGDGQGTVRFKTFISKVAGDVFGEWRSLHEHVDLTAPDPSGAKVALLEEWKVRVWNVSPRADVWLIDFASTESCATESPLVIEAHRYQGFGFRATAKWNDTTATMLTSEGKDQSNGNTTRARWLDVRGVSAVGTSGILFMTYPANHDFPEHLRIWPTGMNDGKENVFVNFNPAQDSDWTLEPHHDETQRYRMLVYDGQVSAETAERTWKDFADPPTVTRE